MNDNLLSVIVPVYNVEEFLNECIDSIRAQSYSNIEIILIDDGSSDNSPEICDDYSAIDQRIRTIHKPNGGLSSARNAGLDVAQGEFITFVDSDDIILGRETFSNIMKIFEKGPDIDIIQYDTIYKYLSEQSHKRQYPFTTYYSNEAILEGYLDQNIHVSCCDKVFKSGIFKNIRFPLHQISEDIAIIPEIVKNTGVLRTTDIGYYGYRYRDGSITCSTLPYQKISSILQSYHTYLSYAVKFKDLRSKAILTHTNIVWYYLSITRTHHPEKIKDFIKLPFFIDISFFEWLSLIRKSPYTMKEKLRSFALCVCGVGFAKRLQQVFTRN